MGRRRARQQLRNGYITLTFSLYTSRRAILVHAHCAVGDRAMDKNDWEAHFRALAIAGSELQTGRPDALVENIASYWPALPMPRALDLACGAGANALWLAERGWDVTAVDRSAAAIELVRAGAERRGVKVTAHVADLEAHDFEIAPRAWDLILMCRYLQRDLFEPAKRGLAPGGVLIAIVLLADADESRTQRFRVQPGELAAYFSGSDGWTILHQREVVQEHDASARRVSLAEIAVRRELTDES